MVEISRVEKFIVELSRVEKFLSFLGSIKSRSCDSLPDFCTSESSKNHPGYYKKKVNGQAF